MNFKVEDHQLKALADDKYESSRRNE